MVEWERMGWALRIRSGGGARSGEKGDTSIEYWSYWSKEMT